MGSSKTTAEPVDLKRDEANALAVSRMTGAEPVLVGIAPAGDVVPGMTARTILTSGPPMPWAEYQGGQRRAILAGAVYEGLADDDAKADTRLANGQIIRLRRTITDVSVR